MIFVTPFVIQHFMVGMLLTVDYFDYGTIMRQIIAINASCKRHVIFLWNSCQHVAFIQIS